MEKGNKRIIKGWTFYDWANSVYNLVITAAIFPIFYTNVNRCYYLQNTGRSCDADLLPNENVIINFFGFNISDSSLYSYTLAASFLIVSIASPLLSGIADLIGRKKLFMQIFCYIGAISCISLFWFNPERIELGMLFVFLASIGFWNSLVFYNGFLPEIASPENHDKISAKGFSMGYFGSMSLLIICLFIILFIGEQYTKYSFILVGIWWMGFAQITFSRLPKITVKKETNQKNNFLKGFSELRKVFSEFIKTKRLKRYLLSFFFFNAGVQTVMLMAVVFAKKEIDWGDSTGDTGLITAILLIQILGAVGAHLMASISKSIGNLKTLTISVVGWIALCSWAYFISTPTSFYLLASGVGLVMGGVQSLARSTYSKFLPDTQNHASYFSFFDVTEKIGIVLGLFFFGFMEELTGNLRTSVLSIIVFFVIGLIILLFVPKKEKIQYTN